MLGILRLLTVRVQRSGFLLKSISYDSRAKTFVQDKMISSISALRIRSGKRRPSNVTLPRSRSHASPFVVLPLLARHITR